MDEWENEALNSRKRAKEGSNQEKEREAKQKLNKLVNIDQQLQRPHRH